MIKFFGFIKCKVFSMPKHYAMEALRGSGDNAPYILRPASFTNCCTLEQGYVLSWSGCSGKDRIFFVCWESK
jgi:hypothetical protein